MKFCYKCRTNKELINFNKDRTRSDGHESKCKTCKKESDKLKYLQQKTQLNKRRVENSKKRKERDPLFRFKEAIRGLVKNTFHRKSCNKNCKTYNILGCTFEELKIHIEKQFQSGMTWENHGLYGWHIDHIKPIDLATNKEEVIKLNHYTNLQPLWAKDNLFKSNKYD